LSIQAENISKIEKKEQRDVFTTLFPSDKTWINPGLKKYT